jgi:hypothetical protein
MTGRRPRVGGPRLRAAVLALTLVSQAVVTVGFPLPASSRGKPDAGIPYPCQNRPCGCLTSEQCWAGDCCCFTLAEKLDWAERNGVEPPDHVRPLVRSRSNRPAPPKKSCCPDADPPATARPTCCCEEPNRAGATCCDGGPTREATAVDDCPSCARAVSGGCSQKPPTPRTESGVRWVVGIFAQKCRGEEPAGLFQLDPAVFPDPVQLLSCERESFAPPVSDPVCSLTSAPPVPPPRG